MTAPGEVRIARHAADIDDDGHHTTGSGGSTPDLPWRVAGDMLYYAGQDDVALDGTAFADSNFSTFVAANVNDGNDATYHLSLDPITNRYVLIDLGSALEITAWRALQGSSASERADTWVLQSSPDGSSWTTRDSGSIAFVDTGIRALSGATIAQYWRLYALTGGSGGWALYTLSLYASSAARLPIGDEGDVLTVDSGLPVWAAPDSGPDLSAIDFLVGTASGLLTSEIVVGTTPGGELGGTWPSPTVDTVHSGTSHADAAFLGSDHEHIDYVVYSGDGSTTAFELPAAPFDEFSVKAYVAGLRTGVTLSGAMLTTMTFGSAPASGTDNIIVDIVAAVA